MNTLYWSTYSIKKVSNEILVIPYLLYFLVYLFIKNCIIEKKIKKKKKKKKKKKF